jgi:hypothetical protein
MGGPLRDAGFSVALLDADLENLALERIVGHALARRPDVVMQGHSGSSSAHVTIVGLSRRLKAACGLILRQSGKILATPHRWTGFSRRTGQRRVLEVDTRRWDYKHQVLAVEKVSSWWVFLQCKLIEAILQLRSRALWRVFLHPDAEIRHAMRWYTRIGRRVWLHEIVEFLFATHHLKHGSTLEKFLGVAEGDENPKFSS